MKRITLILILTGIKTMAISQVNWNFEAGKTLGTNYKLPLSCMSIGYRYNFFTIEGGFKTNWTEYYSLFYSSAGVETKSKLFIGVNCGLGITTDLPQIDRYYNPQTGETTVIKQGYETKTITALYSNIKIGIRIKVTDYSVVVPYLSWSNCWNKNYLSIGLKITSK